MSISALAQEEKKQVNAIKKNSEYIYGIGKDDNQEGALELARVELTEKIKKMISEDPMQEKASAFIVPKMKSKVQTIAFKDVDYRMYIACLYVNKSDILPLFHDLDKTDAIVLTQSSTGIALTSNSTPEQEKVESTPQKENKEERIPSAVIEPIETTNSNNTICEDIVFTSKEEQILSPILKFNDFKNVALYLQNLPNYKLDYEAVRHYDSKIQECFWAVFDRSRKLIAFLDKTRTLDYLNKVRVSKEQYKENVQIWILLKEE